MTKRQKILEAALELFSSRGFAHTTTSLLAKEAEVAEGTIFRYFKTKDDILLTLVRECKDEMEKELDKYLQIREPENGLVEVSAITKAFYFYMTSNEPRMALILRDVPSHLGGNRGLFLDEVRGIYDYVIKGFIRALDRGKAEGVIRASAPTSETATLLTCMLLGLVRADHLEFIQVEKTILKDLVAANGHLLSAHPMPTS